MKIVVLDGFALCGNDLDFSPLLPLGEVQVYLRTSAEETAERIGDAEMVLTNKVVISDKVMAACPNLRYVGVTATGFNIVDLEAAKRRGIAVTNAPAYSTQAVAQHVMAFLLAGASRVKEYDAQVKRGLWAGNSDFCFFDAPMEELAGQKLGILGFGSIGQAVARAALALGMQVLVCTPHPKAGWEEAGVRFVTKDVWLAESDVISLHCPLTDETKRVIDREAIAKMRPGVKVINTARGPLVDEQAMADALKSGQVGLFMADVLSTEPPRADNPLLTAPNTILTPHVAWAPKQTRERLLNIVVGNVRAFLDGKPVNAVNG